MSTVGRVVRGGPQNWATWSGFLAMAFVVVGLIGVFATYATALPYQRGFREEAALDQALAGVPPEKLRQALAEQAEGVIAGPGALPERVARARAALVSRVEAEGDALGSRMRFLIAVFTLVSALFGAMVLSVTRRSPAAGD